MAIDCDLTDNMENLTKKRLMFCQDPNDLVQLSLEREGEEGRRSIKLYDEEDIERIKEYLKDESCSCILVEDAYFENTKIMNLLLDDNLEELCLLAQQCDKFVFIITKVDSYCLPHRAYSKLYFINLKLSYTEVMRLMTSQFNCHIKKEEYGRLQDLLDGDMEDEIAELKEKVVQATLVRQKDQEPTLLSDLTQLESKMKAASSSKAEIKSILNSINFEKSELTKAATPVIAAIYLLSKMDLVAIPSFHHLCVATMRLYDELEEKDNLMFKIFGMFSFQIQESIRTLMASFMAMISLAMRDMIDENEIGRFIEICREMGEEPREGSRGSTPGQQELAAQRPSWVTPQQWSMLLKHSLSSALLERETEWSTWAQKEAPLPSFSGSPFTHLLIQLIIDKKRLTQHLVSFVKATIGAQYLESGTIIVADVHAHSLPCLPIVFLLQSSVEEPSSDLTKLADLQGIASSKVDFTNFLETDSFAA